MYIQNGNNRWTRQWIRLVWDTVACSGEGICRRSWFWFSGIQSIYKQLCRNGFWWSGGQHLIAIWLNRQKLLHSKVINIHQWGCIWLSLTSWFWGYNIIQNLGHDWNCPDIRLKLLFTLHKLNGTLFSTRLWSIYNVRHVRENYWRQHFLNIMTVIATRNFCWRWRFHRSNRRARICHISTLDISVLPGCIRWLLHHRFFSCQVEQDSLCCFVLCGEPGWTLEQKRLHHLSLLGRSFCGILKIKATWPEYCKLWQNHMFGLDWCLPIRLILGHGRFHFAMVTHDGQQYFMSHIMLH